uniref:Uncharacterized protein n=1 Tax=Rhodosorus marinus TaxID=101924 RepID=A0A7S3A5P4_9RHOD|mmetsp:Transcript_44511/g.172679  ORF Transcript_44511/g.172679 Transcript_44511/m.172679 type:complete len:119 (+) Transcript_44511:469-825(+)
MRSSPDDHPTTLEGGSSCIFKAQKHGDNRFFPRELESTSPQCCFEVAKPEATCSIYIPYHTGPSLPRKDPVRKVVKDFSIPLCTMKNLQNQMVLAPRVVYNPEAISTIIETARLSSGL